MTVGPGSLVKHVNDGQLGTIVESPDGLLVKLDRKTQNIFMKYHPAAWIPADRVGLNPMQLAAVQWAADVAIRQASGEYRVPEWISLKEDDRIRFKDHGPTDAVPARREVFEALRRILQ